MRLLDKYQIQSKTPERWYSLYDKNDPRRFVLSPERDPAALAALIAYAKYCEPELATDIRQWVVDIKNQARRGRLALGGVGAKNAKHLLSLHVVDDSSEAGEHTRQHAEGLVAGCPWPNITFLLGEDT